MDGEDVLGGGRDDLRLSCRGSRTLTLSRAGFGATPSWSRIIAEREEPLPDGLARLALRGQRADQVGDVCGCDRVDAPLAEQRQEHPHGAAVLEPRVLGDVDAALLPPRRGLAQRRRGDRLGSRSRDPGRAAPRVRRRSSRRGSSPRAWSRTSRRNGSSPRARRAGTRRGSACRRPSSAGCGSRR